MSEDNIRSQHQGANQEGNTVVPSSQNVAETVDDASVADDKKGIIPAHALKTLKSIVKEGGISSVKVIGTALTAVTVAIVSSKLAGMVPALVLTGIIAVVSALVAEAWRITLAVGKMGAQKVVQPLIKSTVVDPTTGAISVVETADTSDEASNVIDEKRRERDVERIVRQVPPRGRGFWSVFLFYLRRSWLAVFFLLISLVTVWATYAINSHKEPTTISYNTMVTQTQRQELSEAEKQKIVDQAVTEAEQRVKKDQAETDATNQATVAQSADPQARDSDSSIQETDQTTSTTTVTETNTTSVDNSDLVKRLSDENASLKARLDDMEKRDTQNETKVSSLEKELSALADKLAKLESASGQSSSNQSPVSPQRGIVAPGGDEAQ